MKKSFIRILIMLLVFAFVFSAATAEETDGMQFAKDGDVYVAYGYKYAQPFAEEGAEGTQDGPEDGSATWMVPAGWVINRSVSMPEGFNYSSNYMPEKYMNTGMSITAMAGDLTSFVDTETLKQNEKFFDINTFTVRDLQNNIYSEAAGISEDQLMIEIYGDNEFLVYTLAQEIPQESYTIRIYMTTTLAIHKGKIYQFVIFGTPVNNDAYPDFVKLLESITFAN